VKKILKISVGLPACEIMKGDIIYIPQTKEWWGVSSKEPTNRNIGRYIQNGFDVLFGNGNRVFLRFSERYRKLKQKTNT
jgi:hypothetical protein